MIARAWVIARKELKGYFVAPIGYIILSLFAVLAGWFFFGHVRRFNDLVAYYSMVQQPDVLNQINLNRFVVVKFFQELLMLLTIFLPAVTMRLFAEEKRQKTMELLFTSPVTTTEIVLGKYLSVLLFFLIMMLITLPYPVILFVFGRPGPDILPIITGYTGIFLVGASVLAAGTFASSITENQIIAFIVGVTIAALFTSLGGPASLQGSIGPFLSTLSLKENFTGFANAVIDTRPLVFYASFIFLWLFITQRVIEGLKLR
jgi:ABC-2 type transport system permease protein